MRWKMTKSERKESLSNDVPSSRISIGQRQSGIDWIRSRIYIVRGQQVMLAPDLADIYQVPTGVFNQAVKRNLNRFPESFRFQLTKDELAEVITNCDNPDRLKFSPKMPYAFTEQGIAMLSGVLKSDVAVQVSISLMNTFVAMRRTLASMAPILQRIEAAERRQIVDQSRNEERFSEIFDAMRDKKFPPQKVFFDGQVFDAGAFATRHILSAKKSIFLIDSWVDTVTLELLSKKAKGVTVDLVASPRGNKLSSSDIAKFNAQYGGLSVRVSRNFHDRFLVVDDRKLYLFGASLKDLGLKCFAFTELDASAIPELKGRV